MLKTERINIEELPIGCVIFDKVSKQSVIIRSQKDAKALIESLERLLSCWYNEEKVNE